jgi:iron complex outermembrane receptor protein
MFFDSSLHQKPGFLLLACALAASLWTTTSHAQTASPADASAQLESITVTATRRSENLQSVPVDVSVVSGTLSSSPAFTSCPT